MRRNFRFFRFVSGLVDNCCSFLDFGFKFADIFVIENRLPAINDAYACKSCSRRPCFGKNIGFKYTVLGNFQFVF
jgi:hypothetical protein